LRILGLYGFNLQNNIKKIGEIIFLFSILPSFNYWSGNPTLVEKILQFFFKYQFKIVENSSSEYDIPESIQYRLGSKSGRLGRETIIGRSFTEKASFVWHVFEVFQVDPTTRAIKKTIVFSDCADPRHHRVSGCLDDQ